jgi:serine/threonine protein kinase/tetratricopeptide (TPR) repeat protein
MDQKQKEKTKVKLVNPLESASPEADGASQRSDASAETASQIGSEHEPDIPSAPDDLSRLEGETPYDVLGLIGSGGMGTVYKVRDPQLDKIFALKLLHRELATDNAAVKRFEQEVRAASELNHEHLVAVYKHGLTKSGTPYLVMDYVDGQDLSVTLGKDGKIAPSRVLDMFLQIVGAIEYAHGKGVVHRDLKPSNIIRAGAGNEDLMKVVDFGIAKILAASQINNTVTLTQTGEVFGSPTYMSPEQCQGDSLDERSDIYSVGCVMYELLTGRPPFQGANAIKTILQHINDRPATFSSTDNGKALEGYLERIIFHCLEKDPKMRYQSMSELREDLERVSSGKPPKAAEPVRTQAPIESAPETTGEAAPDTRYPPDSTTSGVLHPSLRGECLFLSYLFSICMLGSIYFAANWENVIHGIALLYAPISLFLLNRVYLLRNASRIVQEQQAEWASVNIVPARNNSFYYVEIRRTPSDDIETARLMDTNLPSNISEIADGEYRKIKVFRNPKNKRPVAIEIAQQVIFLRPGLKESWCISEPLKILTRRAAANLIDGTVMAVVGIVIATVLYAAFSARGGTADVGSGIFLLAPVVGFTNVVFGWTNFIPIPWCISEFMHGQFGGPAPLQWMLIQASVLIGLVNWLYYSLMESSQLQATLGKIAMGLSVTTDSGRKQSFFQSTIRYTARGLFSGALFLLAYALMSSLAGQFGEVQLVKALFIQIFLEIAFVAFSRNFKLLPDLGGWSVKPTQPFNSRALFAGFASFLLISFLGLPHAIQSGKAFLGSCIQANLVASIPPKYEKWMVDSSNRAYNLYRQGRNYLQIGAHDKAIESFRASIEKGPAYPEALLSLAQTYIELGEFKKAEDELNRVRTLELKPNEKSQLHFIRDYLVLMQGRPTLDNVPLPTDDDLVVTHFNAEGDVGHVPSAILANLAYRTDGDMRLRDRAKKIVELRVPGLRGWDWSQLVVRYLNGEVDPDQVTAVAPAENQTEAHLYVGLDQAIITTGFAEPDNKVDKSLRKKARENLRWVLEHGTTTWDERNYLPPSPVETELTPTGMRQLAERYLKLLDETEPYPSITDQP